MRKNLAKSLLVLCLITGLFTFPMKAQDQSKLFTLNDYFDLEDASDAQISPDGTKIIYVRRFADIMTDKRYSNLWIINFDGTGHRPLTSGLYSDNSPRWSPNGDMIIYVSDRSGKPQIWKRWMDTDQTVQLTNLVFPPSGISWSPDGKYIAFSSIIPAMPPTIVKLPPAPPGAKWAKPATVIDKSFYRFDGIGYKVGMGYMHLFVMPAEAGTPRQISKGNFHHPFAIFGGVIQWTPDSKYIILSANRRDDWEYEILDSEIFEFAVADGTMKALTDRRGPDGSPAVSPDGKYIACTGFDDRYQGYQITKLYLMNRDGSDSRVIVKNLDRSIRSVAWTSDSKGIYFTYDDKGNTKLAFTNLKGKRKILTESLAGGGFTVAKNGNFAYAYTRPDIPSDIAVGMTTNPKARVITAVNEDILAYKAIGEVEEIWYDSSKDGRKIHGWIIKPPNFDSSKKYPLIIKIHGGPFANYGDRFELEMQFMATSGYVVLYTNPRGSTSYGEEFGNLIHHAYPGDDFYDLNSGVDAVIAKGYIDKEKLYVTGGSGGGVLTCWMIGRTDRFRAAVTQYPVINWYSWTLTADIASFGHKYWFPGFPWDHVEHYEKRSLLSVVKNVKTPTMIMCGEVDWRCPISESEQYYQALKQLKVEAVLVRFPNESHGIGARPSHHISKIQHVISWFDQHKE
ncbi:MAG: S9 family peptidase [Candidatus Aminicenantes bacterium]|nr:MAG: S9 family peptidase [Candidatus Aminicenantes bacterium]